MHPKSKSFVSWENRQDNQPLGIISVEPAYKSSKMMPWKYNDKNDAYSWITETDLNELDWKFE